MQLTKDLKDGIKGLLARSGLLPALALGAGALGGVHVLENSTEELEHDLAQGKKPKLYNMANGGGVVGRLEENYLYSTRRFPNDTIDNTIGAGAVVAGDYLYFTSGIGDQGSAAGYFSIGNLTLQQTNMASGGKIPSGRGFRMFDLGISFNAEAIGTNIAQLMDTMNLRFEKQNASLVVQHGPIKFWPGGTGLYGFAATAVGGAPLTIQGATNGLPALTNVRRFRNPRVLSSNEQFQYVLNAAANRPNVNAAVALTAFVEVTIWLFGQVLDKIPQ
jgi:hypothetical protein